MCKLAEDHVGSVIPDSSRFGQPASAPTSGGTWDARFIKNYCPVLKFDWLARPCIRPTNPRRVQDLVTLTAIYRRIIEKYFVG